LALVNDLGAAVHFVTLARHQKVPDRGDYRINRNLLPHDQNRSFVGFGTILIRMTGSFVIRRKQTAVATN
jgi:hypothetical protein